MHDPTRCCGGREEEDFRSLFDNFIQDLLSTLGLPEWPASETLLTLLGMLLVSVVASALLLWVSVAAAAVGPYL